MAYRNLIIESPAYLSVRNSQLIIRTDKEHSVPVEDISCVLLENRQSTITAAALSCLGQGGCAVFVCDEKHMPCAVLTPFMQHSRTPLVIHRQTEIGAPLRKRLWQSLVVAKIENQAQCLRFLGKSDAADGLVQLAATVRSGDTGNVEAIAAARYFLSLFGDGFYRGSDDGRNAALNYGYAIMRGCIARCLAVYGYTPALGLHHHSQLNAFNLADDFIEPFRPVVDLLVARTVTEDAVLTPAIKRNLFNLLNLDILSGGQHHSVAYAAERLVQSFSGALCDGAVLCLPQLLELQQHSYE